MIYIRMERNNEPNNRNIGSRHLMILITLGVIFFFAYAYFSLTSPTRFVSPDETANYFFAQRFAQKSSLTLAEPLNDITGGIVHPRNIGAYGTSLLPEGSVGLMVLAGSLAKLVGLWIIPLVVSLLAAITPLILFLILGRVFTERVAFVAACGLYLFPGYWYYASRGMMNNLAFVALLVLATYFGIKLAERSRWITAILFGLALGLALLMRTSEIFWVVAAAVAGYIFAGQRWRVNRLAVSVIAALVCLTPFFIFNNSHFHSPLTSALRRNFVDAPAVTSGGGWIDALSKLLFPFGIHFDTVAVNFARYGIIIFAWCSVFWLMGWAGEWIQLFRSWLLKNNRKIPRSRIVYLGIYSLASVWLILMYGSWPLQEYEDPTRIILGHSLIRYWLPITLFGMPYFVLGVQRVLGIWRRRHVRLIMAGVIGLAFVVLSATTVLGDQLYGLIKIRSDVRSYQSVNEKTASLTESNAVVIAGVADKVFFPERKVIIEYNPTTPAYLKNLRRVALSAPLYCYTIGLPDGCGGLNLGYQYEPDFSAKLTEVARFDNGAVLYRVNID